MCQRLSQQMRQLSMWPSLHAISLYRYGIELTGVEVTS